MTTYHVSEIAADGEEFPVPADPPLWTGEASSPLDALDKYSLAEGFAPYSETEMRAEVSYWPKPWEGQPIASAPFTNTEIMAYTDEAIGGEPR